MSEEEINSKVVGKKRYYSIAAPYIQQHDHLQYSPKQTAALLLQLLPSFFQITNKTYFG
jgi:hypothetical protein